MAAFYFLAFMLIVETAVLLQAQPPTCETVDCISGSICRLVVSCETSQMEIRCIPFENIPDDIDLECRSNNYSQAILQDDPKNHTSYISRNCSSGCPDGSDCVYAKKGVGSCCTGRLFPKPDFCPKDAFAICSNVSCLNDYDCPNDQKCCKSCNNRCTTPVKSENTCGNQECELGQVCVLKQRVCAPGRLCIQALIPTCVPAGCTECSTTETCRRGSQGYQCVPFKPQNVALCGGCPKGQVCLDTGIRCITTPCPSFRCFP